MNDPWFVICCIGCVVFISCLGAARGAVTSLLVAPPAGTLALLATLLAMEPSKPWPSSGSVLEMSSLLALGSVYAYVLVGGWAALLGAVGGRILARVAMRRSLASRALGRAGAIGGALFGIVFVAALGMSGWDVGDWFTLWAIAGVAAGSVSGTLTGCGIARDVVAGRR